MGIGHYGSALAVANIQGDIVWQRHSDNGNATAVAKEAHDTGKGVAEIVLAKGLLTREQLDDILRPEALTQPRWFKK